MATASSQAADVLVERAAERLRVRGWDLLLVAGLMAVAFLLRAAFLNVRGLWFDETFSVAVAQLPWLQGWQLVARTDAHPPLHYQLLHLWIRLGDSPQVIRSLSVVWGVVTVAVVYRFSKHLGGRRLATVSAILVSTSALAIHASVEARMYSLLTLAAAMATLSLWQATNRTSLWWWIAYSFAMAVGFYTHYLSFLLVPAHCVFIVSFRQRSSSAALWFVAALAGAAVAYIPWWPHLVYQVIQGRANSTLSGAMPAAAPLDMLAVSSFGGYVFGLGGYLVGQARWSWWQLLPFVPFIGLVLLGARHQQRGGAQVLLLATWTVPIVLLLVASLVRGVHHAFTRYASFVEPFYAIMLAQGVIAIAAGSRRRIALAVAALAFVVVLNLMVLARESSDPRYQPHDWAGATKYVDQQWQPRDALILYPPTTRLAFAYYFKRTGIQAVTLLPPRAEAVSTRSELVAALPALSKLFPDADRIWLVLTVPAAPGSVDALLAWLERTYVRRDAKDFNYIWVFLYERR